MIDPSADADSRPYFEGLNRAELMLQFCTTCQRHQFPPRAFCVRCGDRSVEWRPASGRGELYAATVTHRPSEEAFAALVPYAVGLVDLDEGVRVMARGAVDDAVIGARVVVVPDPRAPVGPSLLFVREEVVG
jgi:uncharacterized OB-fold protein